MLFGLKIVFSCCILNFLTIFYRILFWRIIYELIFLIINLFICVYKSEIISKLLGLSKKNIYIWQARKSEGGEGGGKCHISIWALLHLHVVTCRRRVPLLWHENRELILYLCVTPAARINTSAPLATRGAPLMRGSAEGREGERARILWLANFHGIIIPWR